MYFLNRILYFVSLIFFSFSVYAVDMCEVFWEEIRKETNNLELFSSEWANFNNYGFRLVNNNQNSLMLDEEYKSVSELVKSYNESNDFLEQNELKLFPSIFKDDYNYLFPKHKNFRCNDKILCNPNKTWDQILNVDQYLVIEDFFRLNAYEFFIESSFVKINNLEELNIDELYNKFLTSNFAITKIDNLPIKDFTINELKRIFYTEQYEEKSFEIYMIDIDEPHKLDVTVKPYTQPLSTLKLEFDFNDKIKLDTVNKEIEFSYYSVLTWTRGDINEISERISNELMGGVPFWCSLNYDEWLDYGLIAFLPEISTQYNEINLRTQDIQIYYEYSYDGNTYAKITYPNTIIKKNIDLSLKNFPFDRQQIPINFSIDDSYYSETFIILSVPDFYTSNFVNENLIKTYIDDEWNAVNLVFKTGLEIDKTKDWAVNPSLNILLTVDRNYNYYLFKVFIPILILILLMYASYFIPSNYLESRLTLTVVTFLALIAYIFVIDDTVPKLSYMTLMDYFIIISFVFSALPNFWSIYSFNYYKINSKEHSLQKYIGHIQLMIYVFVVITLFAYSANLYPDVSSAFLSNLITN